MEEGLGLVPWFSPITPYEPTGFVDEYVGAGFLSSGMSGYANVPP
jgi:hypothetical protein